MLSVRGAVDRFNKTAGIRRAVDERIARMLKRANNDVYSMIKGLMDQEMVYTPEARQGLQQLLSRLQHDAAELEAARQILYRDEEARNGALQTIDNFIQNVEAPEAKSQLTTLKSLVEAGKASQQEVDAMLQAAFYVDEEDEYQRQQLQQRQHMYEALPEVPGAPELTTEEAPLEEDKETDVLPELTKINKRLDIFKPVKDVLQNNPKYDLLPQGESFKMKDFFDFSKAHEKVEEGKKSSVINFNAIHKMADELFDETLDNLNKKKETNTSENEEIDNITGLLTEMKDKAGDMI